MSKALKFTACAAAVAVALYSGIGFLGVPYATRTVLEKTVSEKLGRAVTLEDVSFNPWTLAYELKGLTVPGSDAASEPLLSLALLRVDASASSIVKLAPVVEEITLDGLKLNAVMDEKLKADIERLTGSSSDGESTTTAAASSSSSDGALPAFAVYNISVTNSSLRYADASRNIDETLSDITIKLPFVSTMDSSSESLVTPELSMKLNGSPIEATGTTKPFGSSLEATLNLRVKDLDAARLARIVPMLNTEDFRVAGARLSSDLNFVFRNPTGGNAAKMLLSGTAGLSGVSVTQKGESIISLANAEVKLAELDLTSQKAEVENVSASGLRVKAAKSASGINILAGLDAAQNAAGSESEEAAAPAAETSSSASSAWNWRVANATLSDAQLRWSDSTVKPAANIAVTNLTASVKDLSSAADSAGSFTLAADTLGGHIEGKGTAAIAPLKVDAELTGSKLSLTTVAPYVTAALGANLRAGIAFNVKAGLEGSNVTASGSATVSDFALTQGKTTLAQWKSANVTLSSLDTAKRSVVVKSASLTNPDIRPVMTKKGLNFTELAGSDAKSDESKAKSEAKTETKTADSAAWAWRVESAAVTNGSLTWRDESGSPVVSTTLSKINLTAKNFSSEKNSQGDFTFSCAPGGGSLSASGKAGISPLAATVAVKGSGIGLKNYSNLMKRYAGVGANAGTLATTGDLTLTTEKEKTVAGWKGDVSLASLDLTNASGSQLVSWKNAALTGLEVKTTDPIHIVVAKAEIEALAEKQTEKVQAVAGLASLITSLAGKSSTSKKIEKYSNKLDGTIKLENIRYENGKFSAKGTSAASLGGVVLEKLSSAMSEKLGTGSTSSTTSTSK
ncbi:DUF748 domain-containing protein [Sutterella sp.]|uniref:DUF748 domain-containing protein n=1 Tax=Sutterella sp. TaxID=1981025 RepID=UPI0026DFE7C3|nr:DUF748 domain-containing protein [Sutterella sp.]MDO5530599.1 DUF748 domain-containing protein [Sutterella sp.]